MALLIQRPTHKAEWAYAEDIPGTRCGPESASWPLPFSLLDDAAISRQLDLLAHPESRLMDSGRTVDAVNFQPCVSVKTQDRYVVQQFDVPGTGEGKWELTGVFDGHLGDVTVEHVVRHLPIIVRQFLSGASQQDLQDPEIISALFEKSIQAFDKAIAGDVLDLFGGSVQSLSRFSDAEIRGIINDQATGGDNFRKARLNMYGTTALLALVDPKHDNLWIANLGDCQAILVSPQSPGEYSVEVLTTLHNGTNESELTLLRSQHPNEPECIVEHRVLGALAPTRCLGDTPFKQPPEFTRRILYNLFPGFHDTAPWEEFLVRNRTPPYISAKPDVSHYKLERRHQAGPRFLVLCSDGFADLCEGSVQGQTRVLQDWAKGMVSSSSSSTENMALGLLRRALGGDDRFSVSRVLTLDMEGAWIDDTAIVVQTI